MAKAVGHPDLAPPDDMPFSDGSPAIEHRVEQQSAMTCEPQSAGEVAQPSPRLIRSPRDAEEAAAEWCRWLGFADAELTPVGSDGGVDVRARSFVAQVKAHMVPIGRPDLQKLFGVATAERAVAVFFSLMAFTREAQDWADQVGMALFRFNHAGEAEPVNGYAAAMFERAKHQERRPVQPPPPPPPMWSLPIGCPDQAACQRLRPRRSGLRRADQLVWVRQGWLPFASLRYDYSYVTPNGRRYEQHFGQMGAAIELVARNAILIPRSNANTVLVPAEQVTMQPRWASAEIAQEINELWINSPEEGQAAATRRDWPSLSQCGVPGAAITLRAIDGGTFLLPYFAALIRSPAGNRVAVLEAVTGQAHPALSLAFTVNAPYLLDTLYGGRPVEPS